MVFADNVTNAPTEKAGQLVWDNSLNRLGIGLSNPLDKLHVIGNIRATGSFISGTATYPDYVFQKYFLGESSLNKDYKFSTLEKIEAFVKKNHHLPGIKSAMEVESDGHWDLTQGAINNLEKIEELFLHTIEQEKKIDQLKSENKALNKELETLKGDIDHIKQLLSTKAANNE